MISGLRASGASIEAWVSVARQLVEAGAADGFPSELRSVAAELDRASSGLACLLEPGAGGPPALGLAGIELNVVQATEDLFAEPASESVQASPEAAPDPVEAPDPVADAVVAAAESVIPEAAPEPEAMPELPEVDEDGGRCVLSASGTGFSVSGLIEFLGASAKSGTLHLATVPDKFLLRLVRGELVHAESENRPEGERLGEILAELGTIPAERLPQVAALCTADREEGVRLGQILVDECLVDDQMLREALSVQVQRLFLRLFSSEGAWFAFYEGEPSYPPLHVKLDLRHLLLDSARQVDESR